MNPETESNIGSQPISGAQLPGWLHLFIQRKEEGKGITCPLHNWLLAPPPCSSFISTKITMFKGVLIPLTFAKLLRRLLRHFSSAFSFFLLIFHTEVFGGICAPKSAS